MPGDGYPVCEAQDLAGGERILVQLEGRDIVVFNLGDEYVAYLNWCAHQGGPCGEGTRTGTRVARYDREAGELEVSWEREGEILNCPWHGWEYDLRSGECLSRRDRVLPSYPVTVDDGNVVVHLSAHPTREGSADR